MSNLLRRLRYWFRHRQVEADLAEELETHLKLKQERLEQSGLSGNEARYASRRTLGNVTLAREDARSVWIWPWLDSVRQDVAYAVRSLARNPGFSASVILVTSLGIGATTSVFGLVDGLLLKPLPVRDPDRLVYFKSPAFSYRIFSEVRDRSPEIFSSFFGWNLESVNVDWTGQLEQTEVLMATGDFYSTLGIQAALGRTFTAEDDRIGGGPHGMVAVVSYACWQRRFGGDRSIIGRTVRIERLPFTIVGVAPPGFFGVAPGLAPELTIPLTTVQNAESLAQPSRSWLHLMGRLRDRLTREQANVALQRIWPAVLEATTNPDAPADRRAKFLSRQTSLEPGSSGFSRVRNQFGEPLRILFALVVLLFVVACASAANLLLSRGVARQREIAIRLATGASRARLVRQLFTESLVSAAIAAGLGVLLAIWAASGLVAMMASREEPIVLDVALNWRVTLFALALTVCTVVLCSVLPALSATRVAPGSTLKETGPASGIIRRWSLGTMLVVSQVTVTMVLLVGAALFVRSLTTVLAKDAGFDREKVVVVATDTGVGGFTDERRGRYYTQLLDRLTGIPGVESAGLTMMPPISNEDGNWTQSIAVDGGPIEEESTRYVYFNAVSPRYFETLGMRFLQGRDFNIADSPTSTRVVIVNQVLAQRFFPNQNPIGRRITIGRSERRRDLEIVGLVENAKYQLLQEPARRIAYLPLAQHSEKRKPVRGGPRDWSVVIDRGESGWRGEGARCWRAGEDRDRDRSHPRVARQGESHGPPGLGSWRLGARPGVLQSLRTPGVRGVATGQGDRLEAGAWRGSPFGRLDGPEELSRRLDDRHRHWRRELAGAWTLRRNPAHRCQSDRPGVARRGGRADGRCRNARGSAAGTTRRRRRSRCGVEGRLTSGTLNRDSPRDTQG